MNNCFGYNEKNYMCTICKPPYGKHDGMPTYDCYQPKNIKTFADKVRAMTDDELAMLLSQTSYEVGASEKTYLEWLQTEVIL